MSSQSHSDNRGHGPSSGPRVRFLISPKAFDAVLFDLDGVVTKTATVHAAAWKALFDDFLKSRASPGDSFEPFDAETDYLEYVVGKPRMEGVRSFLTSRGIVLPYGEPTDPPDRETICGLGNKKNEEFKRALQRGVEVFPSSVALIHGLRERNFRVGVVSSSKNCEMVLRAAKLERLFEVRVDGQVAEHDNLEGKPAPDYFIEAARRLGVEPARTIVIEDAISGVQAGRGGGFGAVIGVDRVGQAAALRTEGADVVVSDLEEVKVVNGD